MTGEVLRRGPLCWAQHWYWVLEAPVIRGGGPSPVAHVNIRVPGGTSGELVEQALLELSRRHEAFRTVYRSGADGFPVQVVHADLSPRIVRVDAAEPSSPDGPVNLVRHIPRTMDIAAETSFCAVLAMRDGYVQELLVAGHPIALDGTSLFLLRHELETLIEAGRARRPAKLDLITWHPIDQAIDETAGRLSTRRAKARDHWRQLAVAGPHSTVPFSWDWREGDHVLRTSITSARIAKAAEAGAERHSVTAPTLLQSVLAILITGWTGNSSCAIGSVTANRWSKKLSSSIGRFSSGVRVPVTPVDGQLFSEFSSVVHASLLSAYVHSCHDVGGLVMEEARASAKSGARITNSVSFEYHDYLAGQELPGLTAIVPGPWESDGDVIHQRALARNDVPYIAVDAMPAIGEMRVILKCASSLMGKEQARTFLLEFAHILEAVAAGDPSIRAVRDGVSLNRVWRESDHWRSINDAWVNLDDIASLIESHPKVSRAYPFIDSPSDESARPKVTVYVTPHEDDLDLVELNDYVRDCVSHFPSTVAPGRYVVCAVEPSAGGSQDAWERQPKLDAFDADHRFASFSPATSEPERLLAEIFASIHGNHQVDVAKTYSELGGEFLLIPTMLTSLQNADAVGLAFDDFLGISSLRRLAAKLRLPERLTQA